MGKTIHLRKNMQTRSQSLAMRAGWIGLMELPSFRSGSAALLGGTSTAGEQLKKPCGC